MCRKRTLGEVAGERITSDENFACLAILAPALSDRAISGGNPYIEMPNAIRIYLEIPGK